MKKEFNFRNLLVVIAILLATVSFTACNSDNDMDYPEDLPAATGLCGEKWVLKSISSASPSDTVQYLAYTFYLNGNGICEEAKGDKIESFKFSWKSYNMGAATHMLILNDNMLTYYIVTDNTLRFSSGQGGVLEFVPESTLPEDNEQPTE